jgi:spore coat polysaccharide biosynthesis protein SpsF
VKIVMIVQARMTSTRLPGKVLKQVLDKPLLEYQIERLRQVQLVDEIVVATTTNQADDPIIDLCQHLSIPYFRGSEFDVLGRYYEAAITHQAETIIRVTADCPVIDPEVIDRVIQFYVQNQSAYDYVSNCLQRSYPRGMDVEVFSFESLQKAYVQATDPFEREHVTPFIYGHNKEYRLANLAAPDDQSQHRWTVDTPEDFELIRRILESLYPKQPQFRLLDILTLLHHHPEWRVLNAHIQQKRT